MLGSQLTPHQNVLYICNKLYPTFSQHKQFWFLNLTEMRLFHNINHMLESLSGKKKKASNMGTCLNCEAIVSTCFYTLCNNFSFCSYKRVQHHKCMIHMSNHLILALFVMPFCSLISGWLTLWTKKSLSSTQHCPMAFRAEVSTNDSSKNARRLERLINTTWDIVSALLVYSSPGLVHTCCSLL